MKTLKKIIAYILLMMTVAPLCSALANDAEPVEPHVQLKAVEVKPRKQKYSKKNNPAVDFVRAIMAQREATDPKRNDFYSYGKYERINLGVIDFDKLDSTSLLGRRFGFIREFMDSSELSGRKVLNLSVKEKLSDHYFRSAPKTEREVVRALNRNGLDDLATHDESIQTSLLSVMREVDIFDHDIPILMNRFVSPLGRLAPDFYKFYLSDTIPDPTGAVDSLVVLTFVPHNVAQFGFNGKLYVEKGDTTMFVRRATLNVPARSNVNFISRMVIDQEFERAPDGSRLKTKDDLQAELSVLTQSLYARRLTVYNSHSFSPPRDSALFEREEPVIYLDGVRDRGRDYWAAERPVELQHGEANMDLMLQRLRDDKVYYWTERTLKVIAGGYVNVGGPKKSKVDIGPLTEFIGSNGLEGFILRAGATTTPRLSPRWFGEAMTGYGFKDHKLKYDAAVEYSFIDKKVNQYEFPIRSLKLSTAYGIDRLGQQSLTPNADAFFFSFTRMPNTRLIYNRQTELEFKWEFYNHFSIGASLSHQQLESTRYLEFVNGHGADIGRFSQVLGVIDLRYAPGERIFQGVKHRLRADFDAPIFQLRHSYAPKGVAGAPWGVNKTEFSYWQRYFFSSFGYLDLYFHAGHVWDRTAFTNLMLPNVNISYIIQSRSLSLLNPMEFVGDTEASLHLTYWLNGALFNYIPGLKKLKLREVVGFKTMWNHLSDKNNPALHPELLRFPTDVNVHTMEPRKPYMEMFAGLDNIFHILRVDWVYRLNYRSNPGIDRWGIRFGVHFNF